MAYSCLDFRNLHSDKQVLPPPMTWPPENPDFADLLVSQFPRPSPPRFLRDLEHYARFAMPSILGNPDGPGSYNGHW